MSAFERHRDRRGELRVPAHCPAQVRVLLTQETFEARCFNVSAGGMALFCTYVPRFEEQLEVIVMPPSIGGRATEPLRARVEVKRCERLERGDLYEIGVSIVEVLPYY